MDPFVRNRAWGDDMGSAPLANPLLPANGVESCRR